MSETIKGFLFQLFLFIGLTSTILYFHHLTGGTMVRAQTVTGTVVGQVIDPDQKPLAEVVVRLTNLINGFVYAQRTNQEGMYRIELLPAGRYLITAEKEGFQSAAIAEFVVEVNREKLIKPPPIQLLPLAGQQSVPQTQGLTQVNGSDPTIRWSSTSDLIQGLPLAGLRTFDQLALLAPGVAPPPAALGTTGPGIGSGTGTAGQFSINGQRSRSNTFTIDGSDNNDQEIGVRRQGYLTPVPVLVESITEIQVTTLLANTEAGRNAGGQINVVSIGGGNAVHGEAHAFLTNAALNARDAFDLSSPGNPPKNPFTRTQTGGSVGFPLRPNQLQAFFAFERLELHQTQEHHFVVPTGLERQRSLSRARNRSQSGIDVLSPTFYPLPNTPGGPYGSNTLTQLLPASGAGTLFDARLDGQTHLIGRSSTASLRYALTDDTQTLPAIDQAINASVQARTQTHNLALIFNTIASPRFANQFRFSFGRTRLAFDELPDSPFVFQSASTGQDLTGDGVPDGRSGPIGRLILAPFSSLGVDPYTFPQARATNTFQVADTAIWSGGHHTIKWGGDLRRIQLNGQLERNYRTQVAFTSGLIGLRDGTLLGGSGVDFAAFGLPSDIAQALALTPDSTLGLRFLELNLFYTHQVRLTSNLALEYGLRYERNTVPTDVSGRLERSLQATPADLPPFDPQAPFVQSFLKAFQAQQPLLAGRKKIFDGDGNNFAVRVGAAWDLSGHGQTSLRGGYGMFYDPLLTTVVSQSRNAFPNFIPVNFGASALFPNRLSANPAFLRLGDKLEQPLILPGTLNTIGLPSAQFVSGIGQVFTAGGFFVGSGFGAGITLPARDLQSPLTHQYALSFEHVIAHNLVASLALVGTHGRKLLRVRTPNGGQFSPIGLRLAPNADPLVVPLLNRPNPDLGPVTTFENSATSDYHALQASVVQRFHRGFQFQIAYTYAHALDDVSDIFDVAGSSSLAQDETERSSSLRTERASANFDVRHRLTSAWVWSLPFRKWKVAQGIEWSGIVTVQTGQPFTVITSLDPNLDGNRTDRLATTTGLLIHNQGRTRLSLISGLDPLTLVVPFNPLSPINGQVGRNTFRAAGVATVDLALTKLIGLPNQHTLGLRIEVFNLMNRTHYGVPVRVLESPAFGSSVTTSVPARTIQFALRYLF
ncbi:MAG TPA: carboxypeptidase-like regulatory domain-containing protein [Acidobacteriota bacterium]|nr:carboxypeptidase-like regulatory domain-containing protein [Acidobacteriota bacterium]